MAKHNCAICGAEVGLISEQKLADGNYICRKVCSKKCLKIFDKVEATLDSVKSHIEQVDFGTKVWDQIFVPLKKTKIKEEKLKYFGKNGALCVSPSTGLVAITENRYKIFIHHRLRLSSCRSVRLRLRLRKGKEFRRQGRDQALLYSYVQQHTRYV